MNYIIYWIIAIAAVLILSASAILIFHLKLKKYCSDDRNKNKSKLAQNAERIKKKFKTILLSVSVSLLSVLLLGLIVNSSLYIIEDSKIINVGYEKAKSDIEALRSELSAVASENGLLFIENKEQAADDELGYVKLYQVQTLKCDIHIELGYDKIKGEEYYSVYAEAEAKSAPEFMLAFPSELIQSIIKTVSGLKDEDGNKAIDFINKYAYKVKSFPYEKYTRLDVCGYWVQGLTAGNKNTSGNHSFTFIETGLTVYSVE